MFFPYWDSLYTVAYSFANSSEYAIPILNAR